MTGAERHFRHSEEKVDRRKRALIDGPRNYEGDQEGKWPVDQIRNGCEL